MSADTMSSAVNAAPYDSNSSIVKSEDSGDDTSSDKNVLVPEHETKSSTSTKIEESCFVTTLSNALRDGNDTPSGSAHDPITLDDSPAKKPAVSSPTPVPRHQGRSFGDQSSEPIKTARLRAERGDIDVAFKLGWSVERLTHIFNRQKLARGVPVSSLMDPIDDTALLDRIEGRKKNQRQASKRREEKLKMRVAGGDRDAAKMLKRCPATVERMLSVRKPKQEFGVEQPVADSSAALHQQRDSPASVDLPHLNSDTGKPLSSAKWDVQQQGSPDTTSSTTCDAIQDEVTTSVPMPDVERPQCSIFPPAAITWGSFPSAYSSLALATPPHMAAIEDQLRIGIAEAQQLAVFATQRTHNLTNMLHRYHGHRVALAQANAMFYESMTAADKENDANWAMSPKYNGKGKEAVRMEKSSKFVWVQETGRDEKIDIEREREV